MMVLPYDRVMFYSVLYDGISVCSCTRMIEYCMIEFCSTVFFMIVLPFDRVTVRSCYRMMVYLFDGIPVYRKFVRWNTVRWKHGI